MTKKDFLLHAEIDYLYLRLEEVIKITPRRPIEILIDRASGFEKADIQKRISFAITTLKQIIKRRKQLSDPKLADVSNCQEVLEKLLKSRGR
jgi:cystathionine beta-lyase family protein involved in aluminum resistance